MNSLFCVKRPRVGGCQVHFLLQPDGYRKAPACTADQLLYTANTPLSACYRRSTQRCFSCFKCCWKLAARGRWSCTCKPVSVKHVRAWKGRGQRRSSWFGRGQSPVWLHNLRSWRTPNHLQTSDLRPPRADFGVADYAPSNLHTRVQVPGDPDHMSSISRTRRRPT